MLKLDPPEKLDSAKPQEWSDWKQRFERFRCATKLNEEDEVLQINALVYTMGKEAEHIFKAFTFTSGDEKKYAKVVEKFEEHFSCTKEKYYSRASMFSSPCSERRGNCGSFHSKPL